MLFFSLLLFVAQINDNIIQPTVQIIGQIIALLFLDPSFEWPNPLEKGKHFFISNCLFCVQNATSTKAEAERTFAEVTDLDNEVNNMLKQLQEAEKELKKKQEDADQYMMMAGMVSDFGIFANEQKVKGVQ